MFISYILHEREQARRNNAGYSYELLQVQASDFRVHFLICSDVPLFEGSLCNKLYTMHWRYIENKTQYLSFKDILAKDSVEREAMMSSLLTKWIYPQNRYQWNTVHYLHRVHHLGYKILAIYIVLCYFGTELQVTCRFCPTLMGCK